MKNAHCSQSLSCGVFSVLSLQSNFLGTVVDFIHTATTLAVCPKSNTKGKKRSNVIELTDKTPTRV